MRKIKITLAGALLVVGLAACSSDSPAGHDTGQDVHRANVDRTTYENYEDFNNVVVFCDGTTRVYTTTEYAPVYITDDPQCGGTGQHTQVSGRGQG